MLVFIIFSLLSIAQSQCRENYIPSCSGVKNQYNCDRTYAITYNPSTGAITSGPSLCTWSASQLKCLTGGSCDEPSCVPKIGGPDGKVCNDFTNQADCAKYYADNGGDKWCYWGIQPNGVGFCYQGITCSN